MKKNKTQIIIAYAYHAFLVLLGVLLMRKYSDTLLFITVTADTFYLIYWVTSKRESYMPWVVYLNFVIGAAAELLIYIPGLIFGYGIPLFPEPEIMLFMLVLLVYTALLGIENLLLWLTFKHRHNEPDDTVMQKFKLQMIIAYAFHAVIILLDFQLMHHYPDGLMFTVMALEIAYLIYWIVLNRKSYMPWLVYLNFLVGSGGEAELYWWGLTSFDHKPFDGGLVQLTLIIFLALHALLLGIANLVLWVIEKRRRKKQ